ncbi:unnamed protein product, partial [Adineta steineri]
RAKFKHLFRFWRTQHIVNPEAVVMNRLKPGQTNTVAPITAQ